MKRAFVLLVTMLQVSLGVFAQKEVTKFLGIPVDGYKSEMIQKLKGKGYTYNSVKDCLEGGFNGYNVTISVVTNNNRVYRIAVFDQNYCSETDIRIRFNKLCGQFEKNAKYFSLEEQFIPENEDIDYELTIKNKRYEAVFYQYNGEKNNLDENRVVWFMIDEQYGKYRILMFYDNQYNQANGDDL